MTIYDYFNLLQSRCRVYQNNGLFMESIGNNISLVHAAVYLEILKEEIFAS